MLPTKPLNTDYLHNYSRELALQMSNKFFAQTDFITGEQILEFSTIKQINFLTIKILEERWEAEALRLESPFFDYTQPEVQDGLRTFLNILSRHIKVQKKAFVSVLIEAIYGTLQLVLDPRSFYEQEIQKFSHIKLTAETYRKRIKYLQYNREIFKTFVGEVALRYPDTFQVSDAMVVWHNTLRDHWRYIEPIEWRVKAFSNLLDLDLDEVYTRATEVTQAIHETPEVAENVLSKEKEESYHTPTEATHEITPDLPTEARQEIAEEITTLSEEITPDLPTEVRQELAEEITTLSEEITPDLPTEARQELAEEITTISEEITPDLPTEARQELAEEITTLSEEITPDLPTEARQELAEEITTISEEITPDLPMELPKTDFTALPDDTIDIASKLLKPDFTALPTQETTITPNKVEETQENIASKYNQERVMRLLDAIPLHEKFTFIDELFGGDNLAFQDALEKIDKSPNYEEARRLTNQYILQFKWDFDRDSTQSFLAWLGRRF